MPQCTLRTGSQLNNYIATPPQSSASVNVVVGVVLFLFLPLHTTSHLFHPPLVHCLEAGDLRDSCGNGHLPSEIPEVAETSHFSWSPTWFVQIVAHVEGVCVGFWTFVAKHSLVFANFGTIWRGVLSLVCLAKSGHRT